MSSEIRFGFSLTVTNGEFVDRPPPFSKSIDQSAIGCGDIVQTVPHASELVVSLAGVVTNGIVRLQNLDPDHYILFGPESGGVMVVVGKLKPGEEFPFRLAPGVVLRAQADTADCQMRTRIYND